MTAVQLEALLACRPRFHKSETEVDRAFDAAESHLGDVSRARHLASGAASDYGVSDAVARYLHRTITPDMATLETGAGLSTLVIALTGARHLSVTPSVAEAQQIEDQAGWFGIDLSRVTIVHERSEQWLPRGGDEHLDLVLIDGKHAFPWPIIDWFYTADRLSEGGRMLLDDVDMRPVRVLSDFMDADPRWERLDAVTGRTAAWCKLVPAVHDVAWHMQPWAATGPRGRGPRWIARAHRALLRLRAHDA